MTSNKLAAQPPPVPRAKPSPARLAETLGHDFEDWRLLERALTHASASGERRGGDYERLEFLGDRVLGLVIADLLMRRHPREPEGKLAKRLAWLVSGATLAEVAQRIGLAEHLILQDSEGAADLRSNPSILADVCEAVIAALYRDGGLEAARRFIEASWIPIMDASHTLPPDPKTGLQEWAQGRGLPLPSYAVVGREGPDHAPHFTVEVRVKGYPPAAAEGRSKRRAEQAAATLFLADHAKPEP